MSIINRVRDRVSDGSSSSSDSSDSDSSSDSSSDSRSDAQRAADEYDSDSSNEVAEESDGYGGERPDSSSSTSSSSSGSSSSGSSRSDAQRAADEYDSDSSNEVAEESDGYGGTRADRSDAQRAADEYDSSRSNQLAEESDGYGGSRSGGIPMMRPETETGSSFQGRTTATGGFERDQILQPGESPPDRIDRIRGPLDDASAQLNPSLRGFGDAAGGTVARLSPVTAAEEALFGSNRVERAIRGGGEEAAAVLDAPGIASAGIGAADFAVRGTGEGDDRTRRAAASDAALEGVTDFAGAFRDRPIETIGRTAGALAGGYGVGTTATRGGRGLSRRTPRPDVDVNVGGFTRDTRGQTGTFTRRDRDRDRDTDPDPDRITADDLDSGFRSDPTDASQQRLLSSDNPRISASEAGRQQVRDREIEAGRRQEAPADRPTPSRPDRDVFSAAPDSADIRTVSRSPRTGPAPGTQPRGRFTRDRDLSPLDTQLAAQQGQRTTSVDLRAADRGRQVPDTDLRSTAAGQQSTPDVGLVTGSPTLTGRQTPDTGQTLFEFTGGAERGGGFARDPDATPFGTTQQVQGQSVQADPDTVQDTRPEDRTGIDDRPGVDSRSDIGVDSRPGTSVGSATDTRSDSMLDQMLQGAQRQAQPPALQRGATPAGRGPSNRGPPARPPGPPGRGPTSPTRPLRPFLAPRPPGQPGLPRTPDVEAEREDETSLFDFTGGGTEAEIQNPVEDVDVILGTRQRDRQNRSMLDML